jgi:hypothetical protein
VPAGEVLHGWWLDSVDPARFHGDIWEMVESSMGSAFCERLGVLGDLLDNGLERRSGGVLRPLQAKRRRVANHASCATPGGQHRSDSTRRSYR